MFFWPFSKKTKREIVVNAEMLETRVAMIDNGRLDEYQVEHSTKERMVGSIIKGRIQNLEHDLQAAFVDIGMKKNAFLHYWDMSPDDSLYDEYDDSTVKRHKTSKRSRYTNADIERRFPVGSEIVVQVTKGPIGTKGPRVTSNLSIPGRFLVLMPGSSLIGVSRKISNDEERVRLKKILTKLPIPNDCGVIVRTVSEGVWKWNVGADLDNLVTSWRDIQNMVRENPAPSLIYQEPDLIERVVRDWLSEDIDKLVIDSREKYERIRSIAAKISLREKSKITLYEGDIPIFEHYGIEKQIDEISSRKVNLKTGGYLVFDETEALIAIDVNTGRHKGKGNQENAILDVNTDAVEEVARQLRLRNIGGLVIIDLVDMKSRKHQQAVYRTMKAALKRDKAKTNVLPISELGIMEMTRQRYEESLRASLYVDCPYCTGRGKVISPLGMSVDIQRQISAVMRKSQRMKEGYLDLQIIVHPNVLERLRKEDEEFLIDIESRFDGKLSFKSNPSKHVEFFSIVNAVTGDVLYSSQEA